MYKAIVQWAVLRQSPAGLDCSINAAPRRGWSLLAVQIDWLACRVRRHRHRQRHTHGEDHSIFTARRSCASAVLAVVILSVRLSVCLSVCLSHACCVCVTKPNNALRIFWYHTKGQSLWFSYTNSGWWATPPSVWNLRSKWSTPFEKCRLRQISAYNVSTARDSGKVQSWRIGSRSRAFQWAIYGVHTLPLSAPKGG